MNPSGQNYSDFVEVIKEETKALTDALDSKVREIIPADLEYNRGPVPTDGDRDDEHDAPRRPNLTALASKLESFVDDGTMHFDDRLKTLERVEKELDAKFKWRVHEWNTDSKEMAQAWQQLAQVWQKIAQVSGQLSQLGQ